MGLGVSMSAADYDRCIARVRELGWYVKFQPEADGILGQLSRIEALDVPVMIDHMARANPELGSQDPSLQALLRLLERDNFWVMLSLTEKVSRAGHPWADALPTIGSASCRGRASAGVGPTALHRTASRRR